MVPGIRFTAEKPLVAIRSRPALDADVVSQIEQGDEIVAAEVFIEEGIEWVKLPKGAKATRVNGVRKQIFLNLREAAYVATQDPSEGLLLRKHADVVVQEKKEEGVLTKAEIQEVLDKCSDPGILLPLESKFWSKQQLEMFVMSGGTIRPKWCSVPDERLMANINMSKDEIMHALREAADWISNADAILIGSGAGMGVDSGLGTFRGGQKGVWAGLEAVGLAYEEICQPKWFEEEPHLGWAFWDYCHSAYQATIPHGGYTQVREWGQRCPLGFFSFTSNIDSHWITSGTSSERVLEVHGAVRWLQCSKPCSPDVWKAPKDLGLVEDEVTHRVRGVLPTCPKCKAVARPNVQMFGGDTGFSKARRVSQFSRYDAWLKKLEARPDKDMLRITCLEVGCGLTVPTVRKELEAVVRKFPGARLVRINPENPGLSQEIADRGVSLPMRAGAAIQEVGKQVVTDEDKVTFILWGEDGGVEFKAPYGTCLGRLLRIAQSEDGVEVEFSKATKAHTRNPMWGVKGDVLKLDRPVPVSGFSEVKAPEGETMQVTAVLYLEATKFQVASHPYNLNPELAKRVEQVSAMLDDMNGLFKEQSYQDEVRKCTDRRGVMKMAKSVHLKVLPKYGIEATDKGTAFMASYIGSVQHIWDVQAKVDMSMELSYVKQMSQLPAVEPKRKKTEERPAQEEAAPVAAEAEPDALPPLQPMEVTASTMPSDDKLLVPDTLNFSMTSQSTIGELRQKLQEALQWDEEGTKATRFMAKLNSGNNFGGLKDTDLVKKVVYVSGGPGLRPPGPTEVTFTEMAPDDGVKPKTFSLTVMTDDTVNALRQKLGEALGWDEQTQKRAKFIIRLNSGSFGTLKEHEKVAQRKVIFVHSASLTPAGAAAGAPAEEPREAPALKPAATPRPSTAAEAKPRPEPKPRPSLAPPDPLTVNITILGTQDDPEPDSMAVTVRSAESTIAELRRKVAEQLKLSLSGSQALKFIAKNASNFSTMLNSDKVKEQVFVNGIPTLQSKPKREAAPFEETPKKPVGAQQPKAAQRQHQPSQAQAFNKLTKPAESMIDISVLVDHTMNWRVPMKIKKDTTVLQIKQLMAAGDPTGRSKAEDFGLKMADKGGSGFGVLPDSTPIKHSCALELCSLEEVNKVQGKGEWKAEIKEQARPLTVTLVRLTTLEDPIPQRHELECTTMTKVSELRAMLGEACGLDDRATRRVKLLFRVPGGNGFMSGKEDEVVAKEMFAHNIDRWPV